MFAGLELTREGVVPEITIVSAQLLNTAIIEKMPIIIGASGIFSHICITAIYQ